MTIDDALDYFGFNEAIFKSKKSILLTKLRDQIQTAWQIMAKLGSLIRGKDTNALLYCLKSFLDHIFFFNCYPLLKLTYFCYL